MKCFLVLYYGFYYVGGNRWEKYEVWDYILKREIRIFEEYDKNKIYMIVSKIVKRYELVEFYVYGVVVIIIDGKLK